MSTRPQMPKHSARLSLMALGATLLLGAAAFAQGDRVPPPLPVAKSTRPAALAQATQAQPPVAATAPIVPKEWTGESGSSGHPLMQARAIRQAAANFESCLEGLWPPAQKRNISPATYDKYVPWLTPDLRIIDLLDAQPEF